MNKYWILWTCRSNYSNVFEVEAESPKKAIEKTTAGFNSYFVSEANFYVFDKKPVLIQSPAPVMLYQMVISREVVEALLPAKRIEFYDKLLEALKQQYPKSKLNPFYLDQEIIISYPGYQDDLLFVAISIENYFEENGISIKKAKTVNKITFVLM